jgi:hypothetical protein
MTQVLQFLLVVCVGAGLAIYGHVKGKKERLADRENPNDPRQPSLFPQTEHERHATELVTR